MNDESNKFLDADVTKWIDEHREDLQSMYKDYCSEFDDNELTFEDYAVYSYYQSSH